MAFLDPTNDITFRKIFANEQHTEPLLGLLNAVLERTGNNRIQQIQVINPHQLPEFIGAKESIVDIRATTYNKDVFVVQMQVKGSPYWILRAMFDVCKAVVTQLHAGSNNYHELRPVVFVGICHFMVDWLCVDKKFSTDEDWKISRDTRVDRYRNQEWHEHIVLYNTKTQQQRTSFIQMHLLELPAFNKTLEELETPLEKWVWYFKHATELNEIPASWQQEPGLPEACKELMTISLTQQEQIAYDNISAARFHQEDVWRGITTDLHFEYKGKMEQLEQEKAAAEEREKAAQEREKAAQQEKAAAEEREKAAQQEKAVAEEREKAAQQEKAAAQQEKAAAQQEKAAAEEREKSAWTAFNELANKLKAMGINPEELN